jgi:glutathione S-transferase
VDLADKPTEFLDLYQELSPDPSARAKVPILEVGERGTADYFGMIESGAVSEYVAAAFPGQGAPLLPTDARVQTCMRLFMQVFAEGMQAAYMKMMFCSDEPSALAAYDLLCAGMVTANSCLIKHGGASKPASSDGAFFLGADFSLAECMTAPFVVRGVVMLKELRGVDVIADALTMKLDRLADWMEAVASRDSVVNTSPNADDLASIPPYLRAKWFAYSVPEDAKSAAQARALSADSSADEKARKIAMQEGAKLSVPKA